MPLYMDTHRNMKNLTKEALEQAHQMDLKVQAKYGVKFLKYWYNESQGTVFCLCEGPNKEAANKVHQEAHGSLADEVLEIKEGV